METDEKSKNRGGRPPNQASVRLMRRIKKLEEELEVTKEFNLEKISELNNLTMEAFCVIISEDKKEYNLVTVSFDLDTGLGKVKEIKKIADNYAKMIYMMKKMLAEDKFLQGDK